MTDLLVFRQVMRGVVGFMLGVSLLLCATAVVAQDYGGSGESGGSQGERQTRKVSGINAKTYEKFAQAQELMEADNYQGALNILNEIKAKPKLSSAEAIQLYSFYGVLYFSMENYKESIKAFETMLAQPEMEERQRSEILYTLAQLHFTIEDWQAAVDIMQDWLKVVGNPPPEPFILLASAYYQLARYADMIQPIEKAMEIAKARGKPLKEQWWLLLRVAYYELNDLEQVTRILEILVVNWPKKEYWTMLSGMYGELNFEKKQMAAYESAYDQGLLEKGQEIVGLAQLLLQAEVPYKAAKVLEKGFDAGVVEETESNYRLLSQAWQLAAEFDKAIPALKQAAAISDDGELDVRLANSYLNLSRYDECVKASRAALNKGGLKRPATAHELLGMCLFEKSEFEAAIKAFRVAAKDKKIERRARNWIRFIETERARIAQLDASIRQARMARQVTGS